MKNRITITNENYRPPFTGNRYISPWKVQVSNLTRFFETYQEAAQYARFIVIDVEDAIVEAAFNAWRKVAS